MRFELRREVGAPMPTHDLDTPCVVVDLDRMESNLRAPRPMPTRAELPCGRISRPTSSPLSPSCSSSSAPSASPRQKLGEAEVMADAGLTDILADLQHRRDAKLARLAALAPRTTPRRRRQPRDASTGSPAAFAEPAGRSPCWSNATPAPARCGVQSPAEALALARRSTRAGPRFGGLMTYPPQARSREIAAWLPTPRRCRAAGLDGARSSPTAARPDIYRPTRRTRHRAPARHLHLHDR